jgi:hypothetical protein
VLSGPRKNGNSVLVDPVFDDVAGWRDIDTATSRVQKLRYAIS